ncbi:MAG: translation elongation factor Ts [Clostridia bacterium]|nr:translation elongation factor Ts [Clostridia bacterium]
MFTSKDVMDLRARTGVGMMDCKKALEASDGDMEKAVEILREKGMAASAKRAGKIASQGIVDSYIHMGGKIGVMLEVNCETDFVARSDSFKELAHNICMQIAAAKPEYLRVEDVPADVIAKEKEILMAQIAQDPANSKKPANIIEKMVEGRIKKFYKENCLMEQVYVKDNEKTITQLVNEAVGQIGEKISVRRFVRYEMGEGLQKKEENFAAEVMEQVNKLANK